ncbi:hypothetical protein Ciccas_008889 [Cichlidogyrus casuarinus]|uniref:Tc1-like transposase DDE domain-containing protein n=1 Tax=Cichlidogyrus casuarinus TaxID=1844966 RepID=A0ABD2PYL2_9PLAT
MITQFNHILWLDELKRGQRINLVRLYQDRAPCHAAPSSVTFYAAYGIVWEKFPPYSPDLNPIENLNAQVKRLVEEHANTGRGSRR